MERTAAASEWRREADPALAELDLSRLSVRQARRGLEVLRAAAAARAAGWMRCGRFSPLSAVAVGRKLSGAGGGEGMLWSDGGQGIGQERRSLRTSFRQ